MRTTTFGLVVLLIVLGFVSHRLFSECPQGPPESLWSSLPLRAEVRLQGMPGPARAAAFSPDGRYLALGGNFGPYAPPWLKLWDPTTGRVVATFPEPTYGAAWMKFSPDGRTLACERWEELQLCNVAGPAEPTPLQRFSHKIMALAFAPDGATLATGHFEGTITLWEPVSGREKSMRSAHASWVRSLAFSPDGRTLASGSDDETVKLWDSATGIELATLDRHGCLSSLVAFAPDGQTLAATGENNTVRLWSLPQLQEVGVLRGQESAVTSVVFSPDGRLLALVENKTVRLWDVATCKPRATTSGHEGRVWSVAFTPDDRTLLTCDAGIVRLWDLTGVR
jgi:WD40 repeat protein